MGLNQQKLAVDCGHWMLYRYDPRRATVGLNPLQLDCHAPTVPFRKYIEGENRYRILEIGNPVRARELLDQAQSGAQERFRHYARLAEPWPAPVKETPVPVGA
jgi:pyruvate-ferredoxin/flavodoxin oxidoreductase